MPERRRVRVSAEAEFELDQQLPQELIGPFLRKDLLPALDLIGVDWERLPRRGGYEQFRVHIARGTIVTAFRLHAQLDPDGLITVTGISVDLHGLPDPEGNHD